MKKLFTTLALFASMALAACTPATSVQKCEDGKHQFGKWEVVTEATCKDAGQSERECSICHYKETKEIAKTDHKWNQGEVTQTATCSVPGVKTYTCTVCQATKTEAITAEHDLQPFDYTQGEGAVDAKVFKCSRDNHYEINFNAYDSAAVANNASDIKSNYVKLSKQVAADGTGTASTIEWKFYSPVALKGRFWIAITGNTSGLWSRESKSGNHALYYTYNDTTTNINTWKNKVELNGDEVDFENATYNVKGEDIKFAELVYDDFGTLASSSGETISVPMPEMTINQGENTLKFTRLTGYAFNMHTFSFKGDLVA